MMVLQLKVIIKILLKNTFLKKVYKIINFYKYYKLTLEEMNHYYRNRYNNVYIRYTVNKAPLKSKF